MSYLFLTTSDISQTICIIISVAVLISISLTLISCLWVRSSFSKCCPRDNSFKDLENEDAFFSDIAISTVPSVSFQMYPPVVNSMYNSTYGNSNSVYFEPLPDLTGKQFIKSNNIGLNDLQMRPKIAHVNFKVPDNSMLEVELRRKLDQIHCSRHNTFSRSQLQYIKELGASCYGKVLQGEGNDLQPGKKKTKVVVGMCSEEMSMLEKYIFLHEASSFREVDDRNILKLYCQCVDSNPYLTILECCGLGDLKSFMKNQRSGIVRMLENGAILNMLCDLVAGLQALHERNFIHRDFGMRNCLLTNDLIVKIGDYGLSQSKFKEDYYCDADGLGIPIRWLAPESISFGEHLKVNKITKESNIWSFGVLMWELLRCGDLPYFDLSDLHVLRLVAMEKEVKLSIPPIANEIIRYLFELMEICWDYEPSNRPSTRELRISLLHLTSNKQEMADKSFDEKWNQLKPKPIQSATIDHHYHDRDYQKQNQELVENDLKKEKTSSGPQHRLVGVVEDFEIISMDNHGDSQFEMLHNDLNTKVGYDASTPIRFEQSTTDNQLMNNQSVLSRSIGHSTPGQSQEETPDVTFTTAVGDFSSMMGFDGNSLLKMDKYTDYLNTVATSVEVDDSPFDNNKFSSNK